MEAIRQCQGWGIGWDAMKGIPPASSDVGKTYIQVNFTSNGFLLFIFSIIFTNYVVIYR